MHSKWDRIVSAHVTWIKKYLPSERTFLSMFIHFTYVRQWGGYHIHDQGEMCFERSIVSHDFSVKRYENIGNPILCLQITKSDQSQKIIVSQPGDADSHVNLLYEFCMAIYGLSPSRVIDGRVLNHIDFHITFVCVCVMCHTDCKHREKLVWFLPSKKV